MRRANRWIRHLWLCGILAACAAPPSEPAHETVGTAQPSPPGPPTTQGKAWGVYRHARVRAYEELKPVRHNPAADDYLIELRARAALAAFWRDERPPDTGPDRYLDQLVALDAQGRLAEHVLASLLQPGWTIPGAELARIDFAALALLARDPIAAPTYAIETAGSGAFRSEIPGEDLPDPATLHPVRAPCTESLPALRRATADWDRKRGELDGEPLAAEDRAAFLALLSAVRERPPYDARGATWVSPRAYWLLMVAGFCANDIENYPDAERWLESAMALSPTTPQAPNELTHALVFQRKFDRADAVIDMVLANTDDRCELARAWRRRGYIRFEQRRLDDSRIAYQKSLEYDPGSEIARSELALLRGEIEREGGRPDWYVPPPSGTKVTFCPTG